MFILSSFLTFFPAKIGKKIVIPLDLFSYNPNINAIQTAVIDQFIALKNKKNEFYLKHIK